MRSFMMNAFVSESAGRRKRDSIAATGSMSPTAHMGLARPNHLRGQDWVGTLPRTCRRNAEGVIPNQRRQARVKHAASA